MFKLAIALAVAVGCVAIVQAKPLGESAEVRGEMKNSFSKGLEFFSNGGKAQQDNIIPPAQPRRNKQFSLYTENLEALGGGKPLAREQYRLHNYVPEAPVVIPKVHNFPGDKLTPEEAAARYRPHPAFQYTTDKIRR